MILLIRWKKIIRLTDLTISDTMTPLARFLKIHDLWLCWIIQTAVGLILNMCCNSIKKYLKYHILRDEYIKIFIIKICRSVTSALMGNEVRIFGVQLPMELNHNHLLGLFISSPFVFFSSPYPLFPYHHSPCPKTLSPSMLLYPFSFTPSVYTSQIRSCSLTRPPITFVPLVSLSLSHIKQYKLY